jgi:hypothetical protein
MRREELEELHYITPISNVPSIISRGILSHNRARKLGPNSVAMPEIQAMRENKNVPGGRPLHDYANLYICARNPMLYKRCNNHLNLCVLRISPDVLDIPWTVITDGNAASDYSCFVNSPRGLGIVDGELTFAEYWTHDNQIEAWQHKRVKCAEVLVPDRIAPEYIRGVYVSCEEAKATFEATGVNIPVTINPHLFFR